MRGLQIVKNPPKKITVEAGYDLLDDILEGFKNSEFDVIVRPHPQYVRHKAEKRESLKEKYKEYSNISVQTDFSLNSTVFDAAREMISNI